MPDKKPTPQLAAAAIRRYEEYQDKIDAYNEAVKKLKKAQELLIKQIITPVLTDEELALQNLPTKFGTAYRAERVQYKVVDRDALNQWVADQISKGNTDALYIWGQSVLKTAMDAMLDDEGTLPNGVERVEWEETKVKRPAGRG